MMRRRDLILGAGAAAALAGVTALQAGAQRGGAERNKLGQAKIGQLKSRQSATRGDKALLPNKGSPRPHKVFNPPRPLRGMTVSCPTYGPVWGSPLMGLALRDLKRLGVDWVSIHPYASVRKDGSVRLREAEDSFFLHRCTEYCAEAGIKLFYKPHLAYWGSFSWRGAITFADEKSWARFFKDYKAFIVDHARFAQKRKLPLLCLGLELDRTAHRPEWNDVIAAVRDVYSGAVTYGANWDAMERIPFWRDVDCLGVQGYFPIGRGDVSAAQIAQGWKPIQKRLAQMSKKYGQKVLFTELGYARSAVAAAEPWKPATTNTAAAIALRERLLSGSLTALSKEPWYAGAFWWKWMPGPAFGDLDFSMKDDEARRVLKRHWAPG